MSWSITRLATKLLGEVAADKVAEAYFAQQRCFPAAAVFSELAARMKIAARMAVQPDSALRP
jgi:hypothetical protein